MLTFRKSPFFIESRTDDGYDVIVLELPVDILKSVKEWVVARDEQILDLPVAQVVRAD